MVLHNRRLDWPKTRLHGLATSCGSSIRPVRSSAHMDGPTPSSPTAAQEGYIASWSMPGSRSKTNSAHPSPAMSLPGGRYNRHVLTACQQAGYTQIFTSIPRAEPNPAAPDHRPAQHPRRHDAGVDRKTLSTRQRCSLRPGAAIPDEGGREVAAWETGCTKSFGRSSIEKSQIPTREKLLHVKILHIISSGGMYGAEAVILNMSRTLNAGPHSSVARCLFKLCKSKSAAS